MGRKRRSSKKTPTRKKAHQYPRGVIQANQRGFGFVKTPEGEFFIPESKMRDAMDGDLVEVSLSHRDRKAGKREEARVVRVLERKHTELIGRYEVAEPFGVVVPDDPKIKHDVFTLRAASPDVPDGSIVRVRILEYPTRKSSATGEVVEVLGDADDERLLIERVVARHNLETAFSEGTLAEAEAKTLDVDGVLERGYRDIRDRFAFTIDPADAKDFDDALSIEPAGPGRWRLGVHIADVSAYVGWASSIDLDARRRATSVYLADRVIPMLPPRLSEDLCSLRPGEDRLCMTMDLVVDERARLLEYEAYPAVMRSRLRLSYDEALAMLQERAREDAGALRPPEGDPHPAGGDSIEAKLAVCSRLAKARQRHRASMGGIEFDTREAKVVLDDEDRPVGISVREKNDATELIEEAMIFANEVVATHLFEREIPAAYRVHEPPAAANLAALVPTLQEFKWFTNEDAARLKTGDAQAIQRILASCEGRPEEELVVMLMLRAMMRAVYAPVNDGHYGLGLAAYCHFTSPIRRYPDLIVHRALKASLGIEVEAARTQAESLRWLCEHSSEMERVAEAAAFDSQKVKMAEYMEQFVGQEFEGLVAGVAAYGFYVRLDNCVEGLVPVRSLGDEYFVYDEERHTLKGADSKAVYRLGQRVCVRLAAVDVRLARIDFALAG